MLTQGLGLTPFDVREIEQLQDEPEAILKWFGSKSLGRDVLVKLNKTLPVDAPYSRLVLYSGPECEVMVARWKSGAHCAPHDHGLSRGWVFYLEGDFRETSYIMKSARAASPLRSTGAPDFHSENSFTQVRAGEIHSCESLNGGVSLHVYFPRIEKMKVFDPLGQRTFVVADDCGAWIPDRAQILEETPWATAAS